MKRIIRLTESDLTRIVRRVINERQYLNESSDNYAVFLTVTVPMILDSQGKKKFYTMMPVKVKASNWTGEGGETLDLYTNIASVKLGDYQPTGRAIGQDSYQFMVSEVAFQTFLVDNIGKEYTPETSYSNVIMNLVAGGQKVYKANVKYIEAVTPSQK